MNQKETDFLNFENELLAARKKLNDLIYKCSEENPGSGDKALYQDKIFYLETELTYLNRQFRMLKDRQMTAVKPENAPLTGQAAYEQDNRHAGHQGMYPQTDSTGMYPQGSGQVVQAGTYPQTGKVSAKTPIWQQKAERAAQQTGKKDYEKIFGRNFMGVFASVLIFISLIIFATLLLPYLTDTMKLIGLYLISFGLIIAGFVLTGRNQNNKFYIALIGCGVGSFYITLLLSNLYFKVFGDIVLYACILVWAVFVKYLTRLKSLVFHIIGQLGIFISTILGVLLCMYNEDARKLFVLTVFYFIAAFVFAVRDKFSVFSAFPFLNVKNKDAAETEPNGHITYEQNLCSHIFKAFNLLVFMLGFLFMDATTLKTVNILFIMLYILAEFYVSYRETCSHGLAFQLLTVLNAFFFVCFFNLMELAAEEYSFALMYSVAVAVLFYVNLKGAEFKIISEICCFILIWLGCNGNPFISEHLYAYLTVIPFMIYGHRKEKKLYSYAGIAYLASFFFLLVSSSSEYFLEMESLVMTAAVSVVFLFLCRHTQQTAFKIAGYLLLCLTIMISVEDAAYSSLSRLASAFSTEILFIGTKASLIPFFCLAAIHLILSRLEYFGSEKPVEIMMYAVNALLMVRGCSSLYKTVWQIPVILFCILLFLINSKRLLLKNKYAGYYVLFKYTVLMFCILNSYDVINYAISICLLLFAIISIVVGFYKSTKSFRLYGLLLSMVSIFKLIMIDIQYDSTMENAVSFFVSGVLCFIISFIYNRIDHNLQKKQET